MMPPMKRALVCLFVMLSLLVGPLAHAAGLDCPDTGCATSSISKEKKHDSSKVAETGHHCCCAPMLDRMGFRQAEPFTFVSTVFAIPEMEHLASITVGPLLEPPSHA